MNYIYKHWRGELSLAVSFWINFFLLNVALRLFAVWFTQSTPVKHPVIASRIIIIYLILFLVICYPWQIIGLWRACNRHIKESGKNLWARTAQVLVILGFLGTLANLNLSWPTYKEIYQLGFEKDEFANYKLELKQNNSLIHLQGGLGFGVSKEVARLLKKHPDVKGIILDSYGGRIYEGRELSKLILIYGLDTYSLKGCYSAATTAFIAGKNRFLGTGANLAFHQYYMGYKNLGVFVDMEKEQEEDLRIFQRQGVKREFIEKLFNTPHNDLWYPSVDEMLDAGVIHGIINPSDITPVEYQVSSNDINDINEAFLNISVYKTIQQYEPETYQKIMAELDEQIKKGATRIELQQTVASHLKVLVTRTMSRSSDEALIRFVQVLIDSLKKLEEKDPILCLKNLYPQQYGTVDISKYLSNDEMMPMMDTLSSIIVDAYEKNNPPVDTQAAEALLIKLRLQLGEDVEYLEPQNLQNSAQYKRACDAAIKFYELILTEEKEEAGNILRYIFSSP
jgi:hypothetical protein